MKHAGWRISPSRSLPSDGPAISAISRTVIANRPCQTCPGAWALNRVSKPVPCQHAIFGRYGERPHAIGRSFDARIAVTTSLWNPLGIEGFRQSRGPETAAEAGVGCAKVPVASTVASRDSVIIRRRRLAAVAILTGAPSRSVVA